MTATSLSGALQSAEIPSFDRIYIGGQWVDSHGAGRIEVVSPSTEQVIGHVPDPVTADIDDAVQAARTAFESTAWRETTPADRAALIDRIADEVERRIPAFAHTFAAEIGAPIPVGTDFHQKAVDMLRQYADLARSTSYIEDRDDHGSAVRVIREPVGVVAAIIPWNGPIAAAAFKIGPALAAGCTVVLKPSPEGPLTSYLFAQCLEAAGVPAGVVNVVAGGREIGEHLVAHEGIDKIAFTGSTAAGRQIMRQASERIARVTLELGGKSAAIVAEDADVAEVLPALLPAGIGHTGQVCAAITRVLLPRGRYDEFVGAMAAALDSIPVGDPFEPTTMLGPIAMKRQRDSIEEYIRVGVAEGARIAAGGSRPEGLELGYYLRPTLFADVRNDMRIAREEIFGPVIVAIAYDDIDDAIQIANDSPYGLSGAVFTKDPAIAEKVVHGVRTGQIFVNGAGMSVTQPFGGFKQSGLGREGGPEGLEGYLETKFVSLGTAGAV
ncbi:aldehyde dehydrogenase [Streptomyces sp. NPDC046805]|uniref:aldehyde dehydrogenase n=1 Tax=Streptomyces sp. NPDC046805 TaxID=3155134 RepID=UPI0033F81239